MTAVVTTASGRIRGGAADGVLAFKGIPYAAAPVRELRYRPPAPPPAWSGERDSTAFGPTATRRPFPPPFDKYLPETIIPGDGCLNLNVWTPELGDARLPVMVWIHGGGFANGSGASPIYAGDHFARDGVVCVTINYRLGADGFLFLDDTTPNLGLLDQLAALAWVQDNIAHFGGDPGNVTIFGESAGAMSVVTLLAMPRSTGLFRRAVAQSGAGHHSLTPATARLITADLAARLGVPATREGFASISLDRLSDAQAAQAADIAGSPDPARWGEVVVNLMAFEPVVDGDILPLRAIDAIGNGAGGDVDVLIGTNLHENRLFLLLTGVMDLVDDATCEAMTALMGLDAAGLATYRANRPEASAGELLEAVGTDWFFRIPALRLAEAHQGGTGATHVYEFTWPSPLVDGRLGACHALELGFVFDTLDAEGVDLLVGPGAPRSLAHTMHRAWVDFAANGDPGWPAYHPDDRATMVFDLDSRVEHDLRPAERAVWDGHR